MDIANFEAVVAENSGKLEELRAQRRARAAAHGKTMEEELDEFERFIHCKEYVDMLRVLLGVPVKCGKDDLITESVLIKLANAIQDPKKRAKIVEIMSHD